MPPMPSNCPLSKPAPYDPTPSGMSQPDMLRQTTGNTSNCMPSSLCGCECECGCEGGCGGSCGCGGGGGTGVKSNASEAFKQVLCFVLDVIQRFIKNMPAGPTSASAGTASPVLHCWNAITGNFMAQFGPPAASPAPVFSFNSLAASNIASLYGQRIQMSWQPQVTSVSSTVAMLTDGVGTSFTYTGKDANGLYQAPIGARSKLVLNADNTWTETTPQGVKFEYSTAGRLSRMEVGTDRWTCGYDGSNRLKTITEPSARVSTFGYYTVGMFTRLRSFVDVAGRRTTFGFSSSLGMIRTMTTPDGKIATFTSDGQNLITSYKNPAGEQTNYTYHGSPPNTNKLASFQPPAGDSWTASYGTNKSSLLDPRMNRVTYLFTSDNDPRVLIDQLGYRTSFTYSGGLLRSVQDANGNRTTMGFTTFDDGTKWPSYYQSAVDGRHSFTYDATAGTLKAMIDPAGARTSFLWDSDRNMRATINPLGNRTSFLYTAGRQVRATIEPSGDRHTMLWDANGHLRASIAADGARTTRTYNAYGMQATLTNALGQVSSSLWDTMNRPRATVDSLGNRTSMTLDNVGRTRAVKDALGQVSTNLFNASGLLKATLSPSGLRNTNTYDANFNNQTQISASGTTTNMFDKTNRVTVRMDELGHRTTMTFDKVGNMTAVKNPVGAVSTNLFDSQNRVRATIDPLGFRTTQTRDTAGRVKAVTDANGCTTTSLFDDAGRTRAVIDAMGGRTTFGWNADNQRVSVTNPMNETSTTIFDPVGRPRVMVNALGRRTTMGYDLAGNRRTVTNPLGKTTTTLFDNVSRPRATIDPLGYRTTMVYNSVGQQVAVVNALGHRSTNVFDSDGRVKAMVNCLGFRTTFGFDSAGRQNTVTDALGRISTSLFDAASNVRATISPMGFRTTMGYDNANRQVTVKDALSRVTTTIFESAGRVRAMVDAAGGRTTMSYTAGGQRKAVTNALGVTSTSLFDCLGRVRAAIDGMDRRTSFGWDKASRQVTVTNSLGKVTTSLYNADGSTRAHISPLLQRTTMTYDLAGQQVAVRDAMNNISTTVFDAAGRQVASVSALGYRTTQLLDSIGQLRTLVDARSNRHSFLYDCAGRQTTQIDGLGRRVTLTYDAVDQNTVRLDARGFRTTFAFDNDGRMTGRRYPDGSRVTMAWDAVGNRTVLADSTGRYTSTFDSMDRLRTVKNPANKVLTSLFDAASQRRVLIEPEGGRFTYAYWNDGQAKFVVNPQDQRTTWQFDDGGRVRVQLLSNGTRASHAYDDGSRLVRLANLKSDGTTISSFRDTWDAANNRTSRIEADAVRVTWTYDNTFQLTREQRGGANSYDVQYQYDAVGNRRVKIEDSIRTTYTCDAANQLSKYVDNNGTTTFTFDASGNQRTEQVPAGGLTTNTWDYENRMTRVHLASGVRNTFLYTGDGNRVQIQDSGGTSKQIWDGQKIVLETDSSDVTTVLYTSSCGLYNDLLSQRRSGTTKWYAFDPLGSTDRLTDSGQAATDSYLYKAFGAIVLATGATSNPFRQFGNTQIFWDRDTAWLFARSRFGLPVPGRWLTPDPLGIRVGINVYCYLNNNPINTLDPTGLVPIIFGCPTCCVGQHAAQLIRTYRGIDPNNNFRFGIDFRLYFSFPPDGTVVQTSPPFSWICMKQCCEFRQVVCGHGIINGKDWHLRTTGGKIVPKCGKGSPVDDNFSNADDKDPDPDILEISDTPSLAGVGPFLDVNILYSFKGRIHDVCRSTKSSKKPGPIVLEKSYGWSTIGKAPGTTKPTGPRVINTWGFDAPGATIFF